MTQDMNETQGYRKIPPPPPAVDSSPKELKREDDGAPHSYSRQRRSSRDRYRDSDRYSRDDRGRDRDRDRDSRRDSRDVGGRYRRDDRKRDRRERSRSVDVEPLHTRVAKKSYWDQAPSGYEGMTAQQVKETGHFPTPGQPAKNTTAPAIAAHYMQQQMQRTMYENAIGLGSGTLGNFASQMPMNLTVAKQSLRVYVGNIPAGCVERTIQEFFNDTMYNKFQFTKSKQCVTFVQLNHEKSYAFVDFEKPEEATSAMSLDGMLFQGQPMKIRRPKDYQPPVGGEQAAPTIHVPGVISTIVADTPDKLFIGGIPNSLNEDQVMELLKSFGELRSFNLVKDSTTGLSRGYAFCEYMDPNLTDIVAQGLNGMELADKNLIVQRASVGKGVVDPALTGSNAAPIGIPSISSASALLPLMAGTQSSPSVVLLLMNMVEADELLDDEEYEEILQDVKEECSKYGSVVNVVVPRPIEGVQNSAVGKIYVQYQTLAECTNAMRSLAGRKFADRTVVTSYYALERFENQDFV